MGNFHKIPSDINEGCRGGGTVDLQSKGSVVDNDSWRGAQLRGCKARSYISPTGHLLVPRCGNVEQNPKVIDAWNFLYCTLNKQGFILCQPLALLFQRFVFAGGVHHWLTRSQKHQSYAGYLVDCTRMAVSAH